MKLKHRHILLAAVIAVSCIDLSAQVGIGAGSGPPPPPPSMIPANLHPATEESLRRYFEVTHFVVRDREGMIQQLEQQKKTLPPWFPPDLWTETSAAMLDIDVVEVAIPVYQRYYSEEGTQNAIKLFLTPQGQAMISKFHEKTMQDLAAGDPIAEARQKALAAIRDHEDAEIRQMMVSMTPKDEQQVLEFSRSPEWKRMNDLADQVYKAFNVAYVARQKAAAHVVAVRHQDEINKAIHDYRASHPGYDPAAPPPAK